MGDAAETLPTVKDVLKASVDERPVILDATRARRLKVERVDGSVSETTHADVLATLAKRQEIAVEVREESISREELSVRLEYRLWEYLKFTATTGEVQSSTLVAALGINRSSRREMWAMGHAMLSRRLRKEAA